MRVDKDDRYISEQSNKDATLPLNLPDFLQNFLNKKLIICGLVTVVIFLLLSLIIFRPARKNEPTPLTPPVVNGVTSSENTDNTTLAVNDKLQNVTANGTETEHFAAKSKTASQSNVQQLPETYSNNLNSTDNPNIKSSASRNIVKIPTKKIVNQKNEKNNLGKNFKIKNNRYVIQISASRSVEGLKKFVKKNKITDYYIYETKYSNGKWFILVKGNYSSINEAYKAIKSLPTALQKDKPWVKSGAAVNKEKIAN